MSNDNLNIKELDEIIALEILLDSFGIDAVLLGRKNVRYLIHLLNLALKSSKLDE